MLIRLAKFTYMLIVTIPELALLMVKVITYFNCFVVGSGNWVGRLGWEVGKNLLLPSLSPLENPGLLPFWTLKGQAAVACRGC